jgi:hypothetical protein
MTLIAKFKQGNGPIRNFLNNNNNDNSSNKNLNINVTVTHTNSSSSSSSSNALNNRSNNNNNDNDRKVGNAFKSISDASNNIKNGLESFVDEKKEPMREKIQMGQTISVAAGVASTIFAGIVAYSGSDWTAMTTVGTVVVDYISFNAFQILENSKDIVENTREYKNGPKNWKTEDVNKQLKQNTFIAGWAVDLLTNAKFSN